MTKTQLLQNLSQKYIKIGTPQEVSDVNDVKTYDLLVFEKTEAGAVQRVIPFYVTDEGGESEQAYLRQSVSTFQTDLDAFLATKQKGEVLRITTTNVNVAQKYATADVYVLADNKVSMSKYFILQDAQDVFAFYPMV